MKKNIIVINSEFIIFNNKNNIFLKRNIFFIWKKNINISTINESIIKMKYSLIFF
jgi:hypothetical protein